MTKTAPSTTDTADDYGVSSYEWMALIRRARIDLPLKGGMLTIGSYASPDGTNVRPGVARLAVDCGVSYRTAGRYLAWGRDHQLLQLVKRGNRRRGQADVYRLIAGPDLHELVDIPNVDDYRALVVKVAEDNRATTQGRERRQAQRRSAAPADTPDAPEPGPSTTDTQTTVRTPVSTDTGRSDLRTPRCPSTSHRNTSHKNLTIHASSSCP